MKIVLVTVPIWIYLPSFPRNCHTRSHTF